jgi:hypothetical protein
MGLDKIRHTSIPVLREHAVSPPHPSINSAAIHVIHHPVTQPERRHELR